MLANRCMCSAISKHRKQKREARFPNEEESFALLAFLIPDRNPYSLLKENGRSAAFKRTPVLGLSAISKSRVAPSTSSL